MEPHTSCIAMLARGHPRVHMGCMTVPKVRHCRESIRQVFQWAGVIKGTAMYDWQWIRPLSHAESTCKANADRPLVADRGLPGKLIATSYAGGCLPQQSSHTAAAWRLCHTSCKLWCLQFRASLAEDSSAGLQHFLRSSMAHTRQDSEVAAAQPGLPAELLCTCNARHPLHL